MACCAAEVLAQCLQYSFYQVCTQVLGECIAVTHRWCQVFAKMHKLVMSCFWSIESS